MRFRHIDVNLIILSIHPSVPVSFFIAAAPIPLVVQSYVWEDEQHELCKYNKRIALLVPLRESQKWEKERMRDRENASCVGVGNLRVGNLLDLASGMRFANLADLARGMRLANLADLALGIRFSMMYS